MDPLEVDDIGMDHLDDVVMDHVDDVDDIVMDHVEMEGEKPPFKTPQKPLGTPQCIEKVVMDHVDDIVMDHVEMEGEKTGKTPQKPLETPNNKKRRASTAKSSGKRPRKGLVLKLDQSDLNLAKHPAIVSLLSGFFGDDGKMDKLKGVSVHDSLLACLAHESVRLELKDVVSDLADTLCPFMPESDDKAQLLTLVQGRLNDLVHRVYYGLDLETVHSIDPDAVDGGWRIPVWEILDWSLVPNELVPVLTKRKEERVSIQEHYNLVFVSLDSDQQSSVISGTSSSVFSSASKKLKDQDKVRAKEQKLEEKRVKEEAKLEEKRAKEATKEKERLAKESLKEAEAKAKEERERERLRLKEEKESLKAQKLKVAQESKNKVAKGQTNLFGFFTKTPTKPVVLDPIVPSVESLDDYSTYFRPFHIKENMVMAPLAPQDSCPTEPMVVDLVNEPAKEPLMSMDLILAEFGKLKTRRLLIRASKRIPRNMIEEGSSHSWKLLRFAEDIRPAYYGTWKKLSLKIKGKTPLAMDSECFDYDYDSEAEWEEDEPGEELVSEVDDEEDPMVEVEEDEDVLLGNGRDGLFRMGFNDEIEAFLDKDSLDKVDKVFVEPAPKRKPIAPLVPIALGLFYDGISSSHSEILGNLFVQVFGETDPFKLKDQKDRKFQSVSKSLFPNELTEPLFSFLKEREDKLSTLVDDFQKLHPTLKKNCIESQIKRIAVRGKCEKTNKVKWMVKEAVGLMLSPSKSNVPNSIVFSPAKSGPSLNDLMSPIQVTLENSTSMTL